MYILCCYAELLKKSGVGEKGDQDLHGLMGARGHTGNTGARDDIGRVGDKGYQGYPWVCDIRG